jgi:DNA mismatch repair protein MutS
MTMPAFEKITPLMEQYFRFKAQHPDALLFFQVGDFYELFFDDAKTVSRHLALTLTKRGKNKGEDIPLCGVPVHAINHYLTKLIKSGFRIALCEQTSKPQPGTLVERNVTRVFTPATLTDSAMLEEKSASYMLSCFPTKDSWGLVFGELLTAQLFATVIPANAGRMLETELTRFFPDEVLLPRTKEAAPLAGHFKQQGYYTTFVDCAPTDTAGTPIPTAWFASQFNPKMQQELSTNQPLAQSLSTLYWYLHKNQSGALEQFKHIQLYEPDDFVILDSATQKNLELLQNSQDTGRKNTLFAVLDHAQTSMGSRTIKKWLQRPLVQKSAIEQRHELIAALIKQLDVFSSLKDLLKDIADLERIIGRIALRRGLVHDYIALKTSLALTPAIKELLTERLAVPLAGALAQRIGDLSALHQLLDCSINDDTAHPHTIKRGYDHQLDHLYDLLKNGKKAFLDLECAEITRTGINSLKVGYNNITGYYLEITNANSDRIPDDYEHLQTLSNRKRFVTPALKALEQDLFKAQNELTSIENNVFDRVKRDVETFLTPLRQLAQSIAYLDALFGFATAAYENGYVQPTFNDQRIIDIKQGRHPVVEQSISSHFEPNDARIDDAQSTWVITGPNMGGKSTYLRQVALSCIMAQCGSFVPAAAASLPLLDRIFTRIGSGDNVAEGKSTFLVEMEETATICTQATKNSLVILDEVGRGTSTYDGIALAQAILEYLHTTVKARCLFATHYHELTTLPNNFKVIVNYHLGCKRINDAIIFLHKILPGPTEGSFGLNVARLAQLPENIINRAGDILQTLNTSNTTIQIQQPENTLGLQAAIKKIENECSTYKLAFHKLTALDRNNLTPKQAFDLVWELLEGL